PTLVYTEVSKQAATLVVLADQSRSMSVPDALGGRKTRWEALRRSLEDAGKGLARIAEDFEVRAMTFDGKTYPVTVEDGQVRLPEEPSGRETAIGSVLDDVLRLEAGKRLLGVILMSDGAQRAYAPRDIPPQTAAANMKHLGYPLFTVTFGQDRGLGQARDVAVKDMLAAESVFVKNELEVAAQIRVDGFVNREIPVKLLFETSSGKMEIVAERKIKATSDGQILPVSLVYSPQVPGQYKLSVEVGDQPGELVRTNNRLSTFVNVLSGGLKVLYIEGYPPRREIRFLRRSLDASADIHVDYKPLDARRPQSHPANLIERFEPGKYDAYIIGDVDSQAFKRDELKALKETVSKGAGLIMLGGFHSFGAGGYADTALGDILPVKMSRLERQPLEQETPRKDLHIKGPLEMKPTPLGGGHYVLMLSSNRAKNVELWSRLPRLLGANKFRELRPRARELAVDQRGRPLLVAQDFGAGRVMAFAADSTWLWCMGGFETEHKRFWRQVVLWLARKDELGEGNVWVKLTERRLRPGQRLEFTAGARTATGDPIENAQLAAEIIMPDGSTQPIQLARQEDQFSGTFRGTEAPGDYAVRVTAVEGGGDGKSLGSAKTRFLVFEEDLELDNATADISAMDGLAAMTGGKAVAPEQLDDLLEELSANTESLENRTETKRTFWDTWSFFLLLVCLLAVEWFLRKRWGLV
ncbi:MAG: hypothetical protein JXM70_06525, partial [Pirellulales bacterium]|nr:hypothetical protein [Pirellulales bacterium]